MPDRLNALDQSFLYLEQPPISMHMGSVMIFTTPRGGLDYEALLRHISTRIALAPRYRQRLRGVPYHLGNDVWVDDENFDINYHVRRSALPRPGNREQLADLVARIQPRPLDRRHPLWEVYVVDGLEKRRFAVITKTHLVLVDGVNAVDISHLMLDDTPRPTPAPADTWRPAREPSSVELMTGALADAVRRPPLVIDSLRGAVGDVRATAEKVAKGVGDLVLAANVGAQAERPFTVEVGDQRRFAMVDTELEDFRRVRDHHQGRAPATLRYTVNDVVLATLAGALRTWLLARGATLSPSTVVRILSPLGVEDSATTTAGAPEMVGILIDLPVGEPSATMRLQQVAYQLQAHAQGGRAVPATRLADMASFSPGTMHSMASRLARQLSKRMFSAVVTNVPGPRKPRYVVGGRMIATYPVIPLSRWQGLSVGVTSYRSTVSFGVNADREAFDDLEVLAGCIRDALAELVGTVR